MKLLKKVCVLLLTLAIITGSILADNISNTYAASKNIKELTKGIIYKCDLDGDKKNDTIKVYESGDKLKIKVNNTTKTLISDFDKDAFNYNVKLYDFNKNDKSKAEEILQTLLKNSQNFAEVAKNNSIDPISAKNGGDVGFIKKDFEISNV